MFKIEVFIALQTRFKPSKYTSLKTTLQNATPNWKGRCHLKIQYNLPTTRTNKCRALSLQEVKLDGWFLILHIILEMCTIHFMHEFNISFVFHFYILIRLTPWIWTNISIEGLTFESPWKWNSYEGFNLQHWWWCDNSGWLAWWGWMKTMTGMDEANGREGKREVLAEMGQALQDWGSVHVKYA